MSEKSMHSARHRRQSNQKRMMNNKKKICSIKSRYAHHRHVERPNVWDLTVEGIKSNDNFFFLPSGRNDPGVRDIDGRMEGRREREEGRLGELRKDTHGGVLYPLVGGLRFKATSPYPPQLPLCERVHERKRG